MFTLIKRRFGEFPSVVLINQLHFRRVTAETKLSRATLDLAASSKTAYKKI